MGDVSFEGISVVACGTLRPELKKLEEDGFLNAEKVLYTTPGLHEIPRELETQLVRRVEKARESADKIIVVYGDRGFVDSTDYFRSIDTVLEELGGQVARVKAHNCVDMLASDEERESFAGGRKIYWLVPGWIEYKKNVFLEWDEGKANETFPANDAAVLLDSVGYYDKLATEDPEKLLEFSDWMGIHVEPREINLDRFKQLLGESVSTLSGNGA